MKTAVIGGTFDPVHLGHLHLLHSLVELTDYERVLLIPVANPPHKKREGTVSTQHRLTMLHYALEDYSALYPDDRKVELVIESLEIERGGTSYMFDTVQQLYQTYDVTGDIGVVIGDDLLSGLRRWYRFSELRQQVQFIVCRRSPIRPNQSLPPGTEGIFLENPVMEDSSTQIRTMIAQNHIAVAELASLLPKSVVHYILEHGLYKR
jgi:nicotinate-nucleotide adenylyltransferase